MTDVAGNPEEERRVDFYYQPWVTEGVCRYRYRYLLQRPSQTVGILASKYLLRILKVNIRKLGSKKSKRIVDFGSGRLRLHNTSYSFKSDER